MVLLPPSNLFSIPRWLTVRVQVLSGEQWNEVLRNLQTCGPDQGTSRTASLSNIPSLQTTITDAPCLVQLKIEPPEDVCQSNVYLSVRQVDPKTTTWPLREHTQRRLTGLGIRA